MVNSLLLITEYGKILEIVCSTFSIDSEGFIVQNISILQLRLGVFIQPIFELYHKIFLLVLLCLNQYLILQNQIVQ